MIASGQEIDSGKARVLGDFWTWWYTVKSPILKSTITKTTAGMP